MWNKKGINSCSTVSILIILSCWDSVLSFPVLFSKGHPSQFTFHFLPLSVLPTFSLPTCVPLANHFCIQAYVSSSLFIGSSVISRFCLLLVLYWFTLLFVTQPFVAWSSDFSHQLSLKITFRFLHASPASDFILNYP